MNGHRKAITKNKTTKIIQSTRPKANNSKKNVSSPKLEKEGKTYSQQQKKGRENQSVKSTTISHTQHHNIIESIISKYNNLPPNSLLVYRMSYLWRKLKTHQLYHHTIQQFFTKRAKKRKKPGGINHNIRQHLPFSNNKLREALVFMLCYAGQTVSAWNDHYDEEDGKYYEKPQQLS